MRTGGQLITDFLEAQKVNRVYCVPGESYLPVLDALYESPIRVINARHEAGASMMAEAEAKLTGRPGIALVTRGPGAMNAAAGLHIAKQDSTPMILFVGQIGRDMRGRDAFQEVDYRQSFQGLVKWADEIDHVHRIPEILSHAWHMALSGRPGPVLIALPEDMLRELHEATPLRFIEVASPAPNPDEMAQFEALLQNAENPLVILGGSRWQEADYPALQNFLKQNRLPAGASFRRQSLFSAHEPHYIGDIGLGLNPALKARIMESDLIILLGGRFSENPSSGFTLFDIPTPRQKLIHIHPDPHELGRIYHPTLAINSTPGNFLKAAQPIKTSRHFPEIARKTYLEWSTPQKAHSDELDMEYVMATLRETLPPESIMTNGAGNYAIWLHRFWPYHGQKSQLAPTSGTMGYGLPAAIAASLACPEYQVVCFAGDGCLQMSLPELGTLSETAQRVLVLVVDNGSYGTIRMHQENRYPGRISATNLKNPDFVALAQSYGIYAAKITHNAECAPEIQKALAQKGPALLHLITDIRNIAPRRKLSG